MHAPKCDLHTVPSPNISIKVCDISIMIEQCSLDVHKSTHVSHHAVLFEEASQHFDMFGEWLMVLLMYSVLCCAPAACHGSCRCIACCVCTLVTFLESCRGTVC